MGSSRREDAVRPHALALAGKLGLRLRERCPHCGKLGPATHRAEPRRGAKQGRRALHAHAHFRLRPRASVDARIGRRRMKLRREATTFSGKRSLQLFRRALAAQGESPRESIHPHFPGTEPVDGPRTSRTSPRLRAISEARSASRRPISLRAVNSSNSTALRSCGPPGRTQRRRGAGSEG